MARPETERGTPAASGLLGACAKPAAQFHQARVSEPSRRQHLGHAGPGLPEVPELRSPYGYPVVMAAVAELCGYLYYRFRRAGWF